MKQPRVKATVVKKPKTFWMRLRLLYMVGVEELRSKREGRRGKGGISLLTQYECRGTRGSCGRVLVKRSWGGGTVIAELATFGDGCN